MSKEFICIVCPRGCHLHVDENNNVTGNRCERGKAYAMQEAVDPKRTITSTVRINSQIESVLPVKTNKNISKDKMFEVMQELGKVVVDAPVKIGDVIIQNILGTDVDVVATKNVLK